MRWQVLVDIVGIVLGLMSLIAGIASYLQSEKAAKQALEAKVKAEEAANESRAAVDLLRRDIERGTVLTLLDAVESLSSEMETLFASKTYPSVLLRAKDISKELVYLIGRWNDVIPSTSLATIADANAKIEQLRDVLQQRPVIPVKEHARLLGIVRPIVKSIANERAQAQKRKEENGKPR